MNSKAVRVKVAVLDDYPNLAMRMANWSALKDRATITVFNDHIAGTDSVVERVHPFDVVNIMRERTPLSREIIARLPNLKLIASTGPRNAAIDVSAAAERGIAIAHTGYRSEPTIEFTWALILASVRNLVAESNNFRSGGWQQSIGADLNGRTLGVLGLGNVGAQVAKIGSAFGMNVITWSQNMTPERAAAAGRRSGPSKRSFSPSDRTKLTHLVSRR